MLYIQPISVFIYSQNNIYMLFSVSEQIYLIEVFGSFYVIYTSLFVNIGCLVEMGFPMLKHLEIIKVEVVKDTV